MKPHIRSALSLLHLVRAETDTIGVAVSFGKDSLVTLDLCCQVFPRVEGYYLYRVARLEIVEGWAAEVQARHGVTVRMYPHFDLSRCYRSHLFQPHWKLDAPKVVMRDVDEYFRAEAKVDWIAYGWRRNDSMSRAMIMKATGGFDPPNRRVFPLRSWRNTDVYAYLKWRGIEAPPKLGRREQGGLDFHSGALGSLNERDLARWQRDFPFSGVQLVDSKTPLDRNVRDGARAAQHPSPQA